MGGGNRLVEGGITSGDLLLLDTKLQGLGARESHEFYYASAQETLICIYTEK